MMTIDQAIAAPQIGMQEPYPLFQHISVTPTPLNRSTNDVRVNYNDPLWPDVLAVYFRQCALADAVASTNS